MNPPRTTTLIVVTALSVVALNLYLPSLPAMARTFGVSYVQVSLSLSGFLAVTAVLQLILGPLSDRFGRRPVMLTALAVFIVGSIGAAITSNITVFLACRVLQGAVVAGSTISRAVVRDMKSPSEAAGTLATIGSVMALAPMIAPIVGGGLEALFGWRSNFWVFTALGGAALFLCWVDLGETNHNPQKDLTAQFRAYPDLIRNKVFWGYTFTLALSSGAFFAFLAGAPFVASQNFGIGPAQVGLAMAATPFGFMTGNLITRRLTARIRLATLMVIGRLVTSVGLGGLLLLMLVTSPGPILYFAAMVSIGLGNGFTMPSGSAGVMSVRADLAGSAAGLSGALMVGLGAILSWITTALLAPENAAFTLVAILFVVALAGLLTAQFTARSERLENPAATS